MRQCPANNVGRADGRILGAGRACAVLLAAALAGSTVSQGGWAPAADKPLALPTRDVAVIYMVTGSDPIGVAQRFQVTYSDGGARTWVDYFRWREAKYPYDTVIFDRPDNRLVAIMPELRTYIERPLGNLTNPGMFVQPGMRFTRKGQATLVGKTCTEWTVSVPPKNDDAGTFCVTDDGVALRMVFGKDFDVSLTATVVFYGPPPAGVFDPPTGFVRQGLQ